MEQMGNRSIPEKTNLNRLHPNDILMDVADGGMEVGFKENNTNL